MTFDAQPPHPGDSFDSVVGWEWASRITNAVRDLGTPTEVVSLLGLDNIWTGHNTWQGVSTFSAAVSMSALLTLLAGITVTGVGTFNSGLAVTGISTFNGAVELNAGAPITFDGATARNRIFYDFFFLQTKFYSNNIQTLTFDSSGNVTVNNGSLTIPFGNDLNIGGNISVTNAGSGFEVQNAGSELFRVYSGGLIEVSPAVVGSASAGAAVLPASPQTFLEISVIGLGIFKIPLYNL